MEEIKESNPEDCVLKKKDRKNGKKLFKIKNQMEFYFSDANLVKDRFLGRLVKEDADGYVDLEVFKTFNRIRALTNNVSDILKAVSASLVLEVSSDGKKIRRKTPLKEKDNCDDCTIYVERLPQRTDFHSIKNVFQRFGRVVYISMPRFRNSPKIKGFAFIEYDTPEAAVKACEAYKDDSGDERRKSSRTPVKKHGTKRVSFELTKETSPVKGQRKRKKSESERTPEKRPKLEVKAKGQKGTVAEQLSSSHKSSEKKHRKRKRQSSGSEQVAKEPKDKADLEPDKQDTVITNEMYLKACKVTSNVPISPEKIEDKLSHVFKKIDDAYKAVNTTPVKTSNTVALNAEPPMLGFELQKEILRIKQEKLERKRKRKRQSSESEEVAIDKKIILTPKKYVSCENLPSILRDKKKLMEHACKKVKITDHPKHARNRKQNDCDKVPVSKRVSLDRKPSFQGKRVETVDLKTSLMNKQSQLTKKGPELVTKKLQFADAKTELSELRTETSNAKLEVVDIKIDTRPNIVNKKPELVENKPELIQASSSNKLEQVSCRKDQLPLDQSVTDLVKTQQESVKTEETKVADIAAVEDSAVKMKKRKHKKRHNDKPKFVVISKAEWKLRRNKYLTMQRKAMSVIKKMLLLEKQQKATCDAVLTKPGQKEEKSESDGQTGNPGIMFQPGVIVKLVPKEAVKCATEFRKQLKSSTNVVFVDVADNSEEVFLRFASSDAVSQVLENGALEQHGSAQVLTGDEEATYWEKLQRDRQTQMQRARSKKRNQDKILVKAESLQQNIHVHFNE